MSIDHDNLEEYADPIEYDVENTLDEEGDFLVARAQAYGAPVLDLACGTGRLTVAIAARGLACVGVDVDAGMIAHARAKSAGLPIEYVVADVRTLSLATRFRFALLTGHAFQAFLTDDDQRAALAAVHRHLAPGGGFAFENRNPRARVFTAEPQVAWQRSYQLPDGRWIDAHAIARLDAASILHVEQLRVERATGAVRTSRIALRYCDDAHTRRLLVEAGFEVRAVHGDWLAGPVTDDCADYIYECVRPA